MDFRWEKFCSDGRLEFSGCISQRDISALRLSRADRAVIEHASETGAEPHRVLLALSLLYLRHAERLAQNTAQLLIDKAPV